MAAKVILSISPAEEGHIVIDVDFEDETGVAVIPVAISFTLTDLSGAVINSRTAVAVTPPASSIHVVLQGADLAVPVPTDVTRAFLLEWTFDSTIGTGIPAKVEAQFDITDLIGVA